ncbi:MAG: hypothetical protein IVW56_02780 [Candidatus Binataceae bacterium]|nr:hypothetical protein [Candidatus Binataceae bacterium]
MVNPVEQIGKSRLRLARLAAARAAIGGALPCGLTVAIALSLDWVGAMTWERFGYILSPDSELSLGEALLGLAVAELVVLGLLAWRAYRKANDFLATAEVIDRHVGGHQEIITLATLADPANPDSRARRSPLFPMLWRRTIAYLDLFDPRREFRLEPGPPLKRSSLAAAATLAVLSLAMLAFVEIPTPAQAIAHRLRAVARGLESAGASSADRALAAAMIGVAKDLDNPHLPPEQKLAELQAIKRELEQHQDQRQSGSGAAQSAAGNSAGGSGSGSGSGDSKGSGNGSGSGAGQGAGQGAGSGKGSGPGQDAGSGGKGKQKGQQMVELGNDIAKAQAQIQAAARAPDPAKGQGQDKGGTGAAPKAGDNPNASGPNQLANSAGNATLPQPGSAMRSNLPAPSSGTPSGRRDDKGAMGDTHLGETPKAGNYERYYKAGDGPPLEIRDARYVTFRLPGAAANNAGAGRTVADREHQQASAAYTNAPLKQERLTDTPDERQLVPPRYRDLIN